MRHLLEITEINASSERQKERERENITEQGKKVSSS
jgi:hypothetical protein